MNFNVVHGSCWWTVKIRKQGLKWLSAIQLSSLNGSEPVKPLVSAQHCFWQGLESRGLNGSK